MRSSMRPDLGLQSPTCQPPLEHHLQQGRSVAVDPSKNAGLQHLRLAVQPRTGVHPIIHGAHIANIQRADSAVRIAIGTTDRASPISRSVLAANG